MSVKFKIFKDLEIYHKFVLNKKYDTDAIKYFVHNEYPNELNFTYYNDSDIIAMAALEESPYDNKIYWIKHISTNPKYQNQGYAKKLVEKIVNFEKEKNVKLSPSFYTDEGAKYIKNYLEKFAKEKNINLMIREGILN